jgi:putative transposase
LLRYGNDEWSGAEPRISLFQLATRGDPPASRRVARMGGVCRWRCHLYEMVAEVDRQHRYVWRAVDHELEVLESYLTKTRNKRAALTVLKKTLKRHGSAEAIVTDGLRSYPDAMHILVNLDRRECGRWCKRREENSHLSFRRRARAMLRFRRVAALRKFASAHASIHNHFALDRHLVSRRSFKTCRAAALAEWQALAA